METEKRKEEEKRIKTRCLSGNFHTHTVFCDGRNTAQEMAEQALAIGFKQLGFSGHMDPDITMDLAAYDAEIRRLQEAYRGRLDILRGVELDTLFVPRSAEEARLLGEMEYLIGSTHFIESPSGGPPGTVDDTLERLAGFCREEYGGDWYRLAKAYYETEAQVYEKMLQVFSRNDQPEPLSRNSQPEPLSRNDHPQPRQKQCPVFIGHFDLVVCFNDKARFLEETDRRYIMPALETMEYLVSRGLPFEVNCGAVNRGRKAEFYPNRFLLERLREMGGEILINSDAHQKELLDGGFEAAVRTCLACEFTHVNVLEHSGTGEVVFRQVPLDGFCC